MIVYNQASLVIFQSILLIRFIAEKTLSILAIATGNIKVNLICYINKWFDNLAHPKIKFDTSIQKRT